MITTDVVKHIAKLSRLEFSDSEIENFKDDLGNIVEYVNEIQKIDTTSVEDVLNCVDAKTELRKDQIKKSFTQEEALKNAPSKKAGAFYVPLVIE